MTTLPRALQDLLSLVREHPRLRAGGFGAEPASPNAVVITQGDVVRGTWLWVDGALEWVPAGRSEATHRVLTADDALLHTLCAVLRY